MTCIRGAGYVVCVSGGEPGRPPRDPKCWCADLERGPDGYMAFVDWSERRIKTHNQTTCPDCGDILTLSKRIWPKGSRSNGYGHRCPACGLRGAAGSHLHSSANAFTIADDGSVVNGEPCTLRALVEENR